MMSDVWRLCTEDGVATIGCDDVSTILVGQTEGILVSPKQPNLTVYPNDAVCNWHIVVPADMVCIYPFRRTLHDRYTRDTVVPSCSSEKL